MSDDMANPQIGMHGFKTKNGIPTGIRTPVTRMKTWCPRPLDDRDMPVIQFFKKWHPHGDSNPGYQDENLVS